MSKLYQVTHPLVSDLIRYIKYVMPNVKENVSSEILRKVEEGILAAVDYSLIPIGGSPNEERMEFFESWQFDRSLASVGTTETMGHNSETISFFNERGEVKYTVSVETKREKEIMHYWQASFQSNISFLLSHCVIRPIEHVKINVVLSPLVNVLL
jgi:hypothetical protein